MLCEYCLCFVLLLWYLIVALEGIIKLFNSNDIITLFTVVMLFIVVIGEELIVEGNYLEG